MKHEQNENLDSAIRQLTRISRVSNDEIEKIVTAPNLRAAIFARIAVEQNARQIERKRSFNWLKIFVPSFAAATVLIGFAGYILARQFAPRQTANADFAVASNLPETVEPSPKINQIPATIVRQSTAIKPQPVFTKPQKIRFNQPARREKIIRQTAARSTKLPQRTKAVKPPQTTDSDSRQFYALAFTPLESLTTPQHRSIVRLRLTPDALEQFGIAAPEAVGGNNQSRRVTADLLVGEDGQPQAIRFVNADAATK